MFCGKCGAQIPENAGFCENCGAPVQEGRQAGAVNQETAKPAGASKTGGWKLPVIIASAVALVCVLTVAVIFIVRGGDSGEGGVADADGTAQEGAAGEGRPGGGEDGAGEISWEDLEPLYYIAELPSIDIYAQNYTPGAKAPGISWDSSLFYWLEDIDQTSGEDGYLARCRISRTMLRDAQDGGLIQYEIYRDPETAEIYKIVSVKQNGDMVDLVDYYYQGGKPNFAFARQDGAYTPTYATPRKTGERYYFSGDVLARWRIIRVPGEIGEYTLAPSNVNYSQADYFAETEEIRGIYDDVELRMLNAAYNTYNAVSAQSAAGSLEGVVKDTAGNDVAGITVDVFRTGDDALLYRTVTGEDGSFHILTYLDGTECYLVVRGNEVFQDNIAYGVLLSEAGISGAYGNLVLHRESGDEYPMQLHVYAAAETRCGEDGGLQRTGVAEASVSLRRGAGAYDGEVLATWKADAEGTVKTTLPSGTYTAQIEAPGCAVSYREIVVAGQETEADSYVLPTVAEGSTAVVMTWDNPAVDLDLTLFTPYQAADGDMAHIGGKTLSDGHGNYLAADNSAGCEVLYINSAEAGSHKLYVNNYTDSQAGSYGSSSLGTAGVHIYIYDSTGFVAEYTFPAGQTGVVWEVAEISGNQVTPGQRVYSQIEGKDWWTVNKDVLDLEECPALRWLLGESGLEYSYEDWFVNGKGWNPWLLYDYADLHGRGSAKYIAETQAENDAAIRNLYSDEESYNYFKDYLLLMNAEQIKHVAFSVTGQDLHLSSLSEAALSDGDVRGDYVVFGQGAIGAEGGRRYENHQTEYLGNGIWEVTADRVQYQSGWPDIRDARITYTVFRNSDSCFDGYSVRDVQVERFTQEWAQAYIREIERIEEEEAPYWQEWGYGWGYDLINLDNDGIPELIVCSDDGYGSMYRWRDGQIYSFAIMADGYWYMYKPGQNILWFAQIDYSSLDWGANGVRYNISIYSAANNSISVDEGTIIYCLAWEHYYNSEDIYYLQEPAGTGERTITEAEYNSYLEGFEEFWREYSKWEITDFLSRF